MGQKVEDSAHKNFFFPEFYYFRCQILFYSLHFLHELSNQIQRKIKISSQ